MGLISINYNYDIGLYSEGLSAYWKCEKCGEILRECDIEFVANNREKIRYDIPEELSTEHICKGDS
jgi:tRNA(Ile2) C34 agmatinyltransferase TiaS